MRENLDARIGRRLASLREAGGLSLDALAAQSGISRATLSRIERGETSPTANMLGALCAVFNTTLSQLMLAAEGAPPALLRRAEQPFWQDAETGFARRSVSPPTPGYRGEMLENSLPAGTVITYPGPPIPGQEHHLWLMEGALALTIEGSRHELGPGDCLRWRLFGSSRFESLGPGPARYVLALVQP
ncbi:helix-turn-helix transcriptional regulator [Acetobacteraceae bacterium H6797]|nr:helix-turn-helix transcriptional regulator [Acetobacteraceae bacterium H6797]